MKSKLHCLHLLPVLAAGLMVSPLAAQSPGPAAPPPGDAPREAPQPERIQAAVRQMVELHKAGKHEEARAISQRLRQAAKDNPQAAKQIFEVLRDQRGAADAKPPGAPPSDRPARPDVAPKPPQAPQPPAPPQFKPNMPQVPQVRQSAPSAQLPFKAPGVPQQRLMRPNTPGTPQGQMTWPQGAGAPQRPLMQPTRPYIPAPQIQPKTPPCPQCPLAKPQANGPKPPVVRPRVEAARQRAAAMGGNPEVAKIRHLKQAAEHLAAAGFTDHAAKAREEVGRMEAALKASPAPHQKDKPKAEADQPPVKKDKPLEKAPHDPKAMREQKRPAAPAPDATARILAEIKNLAKQTGELNARVRKLEVQNSKHD